MYLNRSLTAISFCVALLFANELFATARSKDYTVCETSSQYTTNQTVINIESSSGKQIKVWLATPQTTGARPYVVFSHGAFSSPTRYQSLLLALAKAGYIVAAPWHLDSEEVKKELPITPAENWQDRLEGIRALLEEHELLEESLNSTGLSVNSELIGVAGHSYGGITAQYFAGAKVIDPADTKEKTERLNAVKAVLAYSPPGPIPGFIEKDAWSNLITPSFVITGTRDVLPGFLDDWKAHLAAHETSPDSNKWAFIGTGVDHYFGYQIGRLKTKDLTQKSAFDLSVKLSIQFLNSYVKGDQTAAECLKKTQTEVNKGKIAELINR